jgi:hypothetical protein
METKSPPAYDGGWGTSCRFSPKPRFTKGHQTTVDFVIYTETSAAKARQTFDQTGAVIRQDEAQTFRVRRRSVLGNHRR